MSRGRRPGAPDTRAEVLAAARELFAQKGFGGTTIRSVAVAAGVDPSLVHHFFGSKDDLFIAALELPVDVRAVLIPVAAEGADGAAERLLRVMLSVWDDPAMQLPLLGMLRRAIEPGGERLIREGFLPVVIGPVGTALGIDRPDLRIPLMASQVLGLLVCRYLLHIEPVASMSAEQVVAAYAPTIQRYLTGTLADVQA